MSDAPQIKDEPHIKVAEHGPYIVSGQVPVRVKTPVTSEHGEPLTWKSGPPRETGARYLLCRCGHSENKPMCDGSHARVDWDSTDGAPEVPYAERAKSHGGEGIEIFDDRPTCVHAGFCGNEVTNVWKMARKTGDSRIRAQAMAMIERCPSGALTYAVDGEQIEPALAAEIAPTPDGPLWVTGGISVERSDGTPLETRNRVTLCRCGHSGSKPLCDGSHTEAGFTG